MRVRRNHPYFFFGIFHYKPSSYRGTPVAHLWKPRIESSVSNSPDPESLDVDTD